MNNSIVIQHLQKLKPTDGFTIDEYMNQDGKKMVMLKRRGVPLSSDTTGFFGLYLEPQTQCVVGLLLPVEDQQQEEFADAVVLVEKNGIVARDQRVVRVKYRPAIHKQSSNNKNNSSDNRRTLSSSSTPVRPRNSTHGTSTNNVQMPNIQELVQNFIDKTSDSDQLLQYGAYAIAGIVILKWVLRAIFGLSILLIPLGFLMSKTNPPAESFDAKKELKRVLRGHHLPNDHPEKPKNWLERTASRVIASVTTELATSTGYEITMTDILGLASIARVRVPSAHIEVFWIGCFNTWTFVRQREFDD